MKAAYIQQTGPPENIVYGELPVPKPGAAQCLVKVGAVSVNPVDTYIRSGLVQMPLPFPFVVGCDLAGVVAEVGSQVTRFEAGDRVWGSNQGLLGRQGTFAEFCAVDECWLYRTPDGVSHEQAAAVALVGITAHLGAVRTAGLRKGETIFVNGGSGGVGSMVVQMARAIGARVIATAGSGP
jgi:NADPH2:quinone reductase